MHKGGTVTKFYQNAPPICPISQKIWDILEKILLGARSPCSTTCRYKAFSIKINVAAVAGGRASLVNNAWKQFWS